MGAVGSMMGAIVGLMMGAVGSLGALRSMGDANRWRWPGGLMESSRERIIGLMGANVGSMGSSRERIIGLMEAVAGSMGAMVGSMEAVAGSMGSS
jgi:hypothetical protein